jgi:hypothetical protein
LRSFRFVQVLSAAKLCSQEGQFHCGLDSDLHASKSFGLLQSSAATITKINQRIEHPE